MTSDLFHKPVPVDASVSTLSVEAPPDAVPFISEPAALPADLLDGGEVVFLAVKPSPWSVVFCSLPWVLGGLMISVFAGWFATRSALIVEGAFLQVIWAVVGLRIGLAIMQWVSRVYILTNRRIMRIHGVFRVNLFECPLASIINTGVTIGPHEAPVKLGTIWFNTGQNVSDSSWYHLARPHEVHDRIRRAIERTLDNSP